MKKYNWNIQARKNNKTEFFGPLFLNKKELTEQIDALQLAGYTAICAVKTE